MELLVERLFQAGDGLEADFCHTVGDMDPQEPGRLQGYSPFRRWHCAHSRGVLSFLAPRWRRPLELCTPVMMDLVVMFSLIQWKLGAPFGVLPFLS